MSIEPQSDHLPPTSSEISKLEGLLGHGFPTSYVNYLLKENGMDGFVGPNYVRFYSAQMLASENYDEWKESFPNTLRIGDTGALENFVINFDFEPPRFGMLPNIGDKSDFIDLGNEWYEMIDRLSDDTIFDNKVRIRINRSITTVIPGTSVAAAILNSGIEHLRTSIASESRAPLCGMGICFECRVTVNGIPHQRSCAILAENGMEVVTGD